MRTRIAELSRKSSETEVHIKINLDGHGKYDFDSPIPFLEHMLSHVAKQSMIDISLKLRGDIGIDCHHCVEDTAIVFGKALRQALGEKKGIARYGHFTLPMDEVLSAVALDLSGRFSFVYTGPEHINTGQFGIYDAELSLEFLQKFAMNAAMNLHVLIHYGHNRHHLHEAVFKALGRALGMALKYDPQRSQNTASTKGFLE